MARLIQSDATGFACPKCGFFNPIEDGCKKSYLGHDTPWKVICVCDATYQVRKGEVYWLTQHFLLPQMPQNPPTQPAKLPPLPALPALPPLRPLPPILPPLP